MKNCSTLYIRKENATMKKIISLTIIICLMLTSVVACSSSDDDSDQTGRRRRRRNDPETTQDVDVDVDIDDTEKTEPTDKPTETTEPTETQTDVNIVPTENASIKWVDYTSPDGFFNVTIPEGWVVSYNNIDTIGYEVFITNPAGTRHLYFCTSVVSYPSEENFEYWRQISLQVGLPLPEHGYISPVATAQSLFENSDAYFGFHDFTVIQNMGQNGYGGDILEANVTRNTDDTLYHGIFTSSLIDTPMYYQSMDVDLAIGTMGILLLPEEYYDWIDIMIQIYSTLVFTPAYYSARDYAWQQVGYASQSIMFAADQMSAMIMDSWNQSMHTSDIASQAYSDATLGRERIYDTETGEVYYADNGWYDSYYGSRYELVETGSDYYLLPVTGTIS